MTHVHTGYAVSLLPDQQRYAINVVIFGVTIDDATTRKFQKCGLICITLLKEKGEGAYHSQSIIDNDSQR